MIHVRKRNYKYLGHLLYIAITSNSNTSSNSRIVVVIACSSDFFRCCHTQWIVSNRSTCIMHVLQDTALMNIPNVATCVMYVLSAIYCGNDTILYYTPIPFCCLSVLLLLLLLYRIMVVFCNGRTTL